MITRRFTLSRLRAAARGWLLVSLLGLAGCGGWRTLHRPDTGPRARPSDQELDRRAEAWAHFAAATVHDGLAETDLALEEYRQSLEADPDHESLAVDLARRHLQRKEPEKAREALHITIAHGHPTGLAYGWLGVAEEAAGHRQAAREAFRESLRRSPGLFLGYRGLAGLAYQAKDADQALRVLDQAAEQKDADALFLVSLADTLARGARQKVLTNDQVKDRIKRVVDRAEKLGVTRPDLLRQMGALYQAGGHFPEAIAVYEQLVRALPPGNPPLSILLHQQLFQLYRQAGNLPQAEAQLQAILDLNPTNPQSHLLLARLAVEQKNYVKAAGHLRQLVLLHPGFEPAYYELAALQITVGRPRDALTTLDNARKRFKANFALEFYSGLAAAATDQLEAALKHFGSAEILGRVDSPERLDTFFYFQFASVHERLHHYEQAAKFLKQALELDPGNAAAMNYLGYMWADRGEHLTEARDLIEKAVAKEPDNPAYLDSLAWVLFKLGRVEDALPHQLRANELQPEPDATLLEHLGDIYAAMGRGAEARDAYTRSLAVKPNEAVQRRLEGLPPQ